MNPSPTSDPDFSQFVRDGSAAAFRWMVERHLGGVLATARRVLGARRDLAEDVAQTVFVRLARKGRSLPETLVVGAWLHRQTVRLALNEVRGETRRNLREQRAAELQSIDAMNPKFPGDESPLEDLMPQIDRAVLELPELERAALALRFYEGATFRDIGERLGLSTAATEKRVTRALEKLRTRLVLRGVTISTASLGVFLTENSAAAAAPALVSSIATHASAQISSGGAVGILSNTLTMTCLKSLAAGLGIGFLVGGGLMALPEPGGRPGSAAVAAGKAASRLTAVVHRDSRHRWEVPQAAGSVEAIFAQVQQLLAEPDNEITRLRLRGLLDQLEPEQCAPLLSLLATELNLKRGRRVIPDLARAWALIDPVVAMQGLIAGPLLAETWSGWPNSMAASAFQVWNETDPEAAQRWLVNSQNDAVFREAIPSMISSVASGLVSNSESSAIEWAVQLEGEDYQRAALAPLWNRFTGNSAGEHRADLERLLSTFMALEDAEVGRLAVVGLAGDWAKVRPSEFQEWLDLQVPGPLAYEAAAAMLGLFRLEKIEPTGVWMREFDRVAAAERALRLAGDRPEAEVVSELVQRMPSVPDGVAEWALPKLSGTGGDAAMLHAAQVASDPSLGFRRDKKSPSQVAFDWAIQISDPSVRDPLIYGQYQKWLEHDRWNLNGEAEAFLDSSDWPEELKSILRRAKADLD